MFSKTYRRPKNGPVITRKFRSTEHMELFDKKKISYEEATYIVGDGSQVLEMVTQYKLKGALRFVKNYCYPEVFHPNATNFIVVSEDTGSVDIRRYLYVERLVETVTDMKHTVYVTNADIT